MGDAHLDDRDADSSRTRSRTRSVKELQGVKRAGKRKTPNVVSRSDEGEYVATPTPTYSDDVEHGHGAIPVPTFIEDETEETTSQSGVRTVER